MKIRSEKYKKENLGPIIASSKSKAEALRKLSLQDGKSGNYQTLDKYIKLHNLDTSHFTGKGWNIGLKFKPNKPMPLSEVLVENSTYTNIYMLKIKLQKANLLEYKCNKCGIYDWQGKKLSLHLDHINGVKDDHRLENLRFLCPNCHSQTSTYCGKNKRKATYICNKCGKQIRSNRKYCNECFKKTEGHYHKENGEIKKGHCITNDKEAKHKPSIPCKQCNKEFPPNNNDQKFCSRKCYHISTKGKSKPEARKAERPSKEKLKILLEESNFSAIGRQYGVSDNAVRKWAKYYDLI